MLALLVALFLQVPPGDSIDPSDTVSWGNDAVYQSATIFEPPNWDGGSVVLYFTHGGFLPQRPTARLNDVPEGIQRYWFHQMLFELYEDGACIITAGCLGTDDPAAGTGRGFFRMPNNASYWEVDTEWLVYKDGVRAAEVVRQRYPDACVAVVGKSAGAMSALFAGTLSVLQPQAIVSLEMPVSWPALRQDLQHLPRSFFRKEGTSAEAAGPLENAPFLELAGASLITAQSAGVPLFLAGTYVAEHGVVDARPGKGDYNLLSEVHDYGAIAGFWLERMFTGRGTSDDELWVEAGAALTIPGEQSYQAGSYLPDRTFALPCVQEQDRWIRARLGLPDGHLSE